MPNHTQPAFDPVQFSWVKGEIEHSLAKARKNLDIVNANPKDTKVIQSIGADLHQVTGALLMVGLGAAARLNEEAEKLVASFKEGIPEGAAKHLALLRQATANLSDYLDGLADGRPDRPMELAPTYVLLNKARGVNDASASDLFSPDLSTPSSGMDDADELPEKTVSAGAINLSRGMFQAGLMKLVRNKDLAGGARDMRDAVLAIEALNVSPSSRAFWFIAAGFLDTVLNDPASVNQAAPLFGKIDQQIKGLMEGHNNAPERLLRDMLLVIGRSTATSERIGQIRQIYRLDDLLALPDAKSPAKGNKALIPIIGALQDQVRSLRHEFQEFTGGAASALPAFVKLAAQLTAAEQQLPNREMARLLRVLGAIGQHLDKTRMPPTELQSLEIATAILFVESSLEEYFKLTPEFEQQAALICSRIQNVMTGVELPDPKLSGINLSETMLLQTQTQLLVSQVCKESRANLVLIESALDNYFRDTKKVEGLAALEQLFKQIEGAMAMLDQDEAAALSKALVERTAQLADGKARNQDVESQTVAEGVSALGLFMEALQHGAADARDKLLPALSRFGIAQKPAAANKAPAKTPAANTASTGKTARQATATVVKAPPVAPSAAPAAPGELELLKQSVASLKALLQERDQRIRALQLQMIALHRKAKLADELQAKMSQFQSTEKRLR